jgi:GTP-sensing pleiotropic transcriptional regulator CodY
MPGHAGVGGNERAYKLASSATIADGQPIDRADIANALRELCRLEESTSLVRIRELGVKIGQK